jgi:hypothetical protein
LEGQAIGPRCDLDDPEKADIGGLIKLRRLSSGLSNMLLSSAIG